MGKFIVSFALRQVLLLALVASDSVTGDRARGRKRATSTHGQPPERFDPVTEASVPAEGFGGLGFEDPLKPQSGSKEDPVGIENHCLERASCRNVDRSSIPRSANDIFTRNCYCDDMCQTYDDCCKDYDLRQHQLSVETLTLAPEVIACQALGVVFKDKEDRDQLRTKERKFQVVNDCPANSGEQFIQKTCRLGTSSDSDIFLRVPVNGKKSGVLYLNYYCAICNGDSDVIFWSGILDACKGSLDSDSREGNEDQDVNSRNYTQELLRNNTGCRIVFDFPDGYRPRPCKNVTRKCHRNWADRRTARKCQDRSQLTSYVYHGYSMTLRNRFCATCNYINDTDTTCVDPSVPKVQSPPYIPPPYSILIDLNAKELAVNEQGGSRKESVVELRDCGHGFVYDPFAEFCRLSYCPKGYTLTDGGCVLSIDSENGRNHSEINQNLSESVTGKLKCLQTISLNESEYRIHDSNGSAYVFKMDRWYEQGEYSHAPPFLFICTPSTSRLYNVTINATELMFQYDPVQQFLSFIGTIVSLMSLLILFLVYMVFPVLHNTPGKCVICLIVSLFVGQFSYIFSGYQSPACFYLAAAMHFGFLAAFFWINVMAFDICRAFMSNTSTTLSASGSRSRRFLFFALYAWLTPAAIVGGCVALDILELEEAFRPHYSDTNRLCWITSRTALIVFFAVPVAVILILNLVFFVIAVICISKASSVAETATSKSHTKGLLVVCVKLSCIMGLTWIFGFVATFTDLTVLWYLFIVFNSLQGLFLCVIFLCTKKVLRLVRNKWSPASTDSTSQQKNRKPPTSSSESSASKDKSRIISKETCM